MPGSLPGRLDDIDRRITRWMAAHGVCLTRLGLGLLTGRFLRATLLLLFVQMPGTMLPLFLFPAETFNAFPHAPTLEGQYIVKNFVLVGAAIVIGATVRGGRLEAESEATGEKR